MGGVHIPAQFSSPSLPTIRYTKTGSRTKCSCDMIPADIHYMTSRLSPRGWRRCSAFSCLRIDFLVEIYFFLFFFFLCSALVSNDSWSVPGAENQKTCLKRQLSRIRFDHNSFGISLFCRPANKDISCLEPMERGWLSNGKFGN